MVVWCAGHRRATVRLVFPHFAPMTSCIAGSNCLSCIDTAQQFAHDAPPVVRSGLASHPSRYTCPLLLENPCANPPARACVALRCLNPPCACWRWCLPDSRYSRSRIGMSRAISRAWPCMRLPAKARSPAQIRRPFCPQRRLPYRRATHSRGISPQPLRATLPVSRGNFPDPACRPGTSKFSRQARRCLQTLPMPGFRKLNVARPSATTSSPSSMLRIARAAGSTAPGRSRARISSTRIPCA